MADKTYRSPGNPNNCAEPGCGHLPAMHEDGKGGLGPCWGRSASERHWWTRRACRCECFQLQPGGVTISLGDVAPGESRAIRVRFPSVTPGDPEVPPGNRRFRG